MYPYREGFFVQDKLVLICLTLILLSFSLPLNVTISSFNNIFFCRSIKIKVSDETEWMLGQPGKKLVPYNIFKGDTNKIKTKPHLKSHMSKRHCKRSRLLNSVYGWQLNNFSVIFFFKLGRLKSNEQPIGTRSDVQDSCFPLRNQEFGSPHLPMCVLLFESFSFISLFLGLFPRTPL